MEQAEIRKLYHKDTDGTIHQYYPLVHEDAVRDSDNTPISKSYTKAVLVNGSPTSSVNGVWTCSVDKSDTDIIQMLLDGKIAYWVIKTNGTILFECPISLYFNGQGGRYLYGSYCTYVQSSLGSDVYEFKQTGTTLTITHGVLATSEALTNKGYLTSNDFSTDMVVTFEDGSTATYKLKS